LARAAPPIAIAALALLAAGCGPGDAPAAPPPAEIRGAAIDGSSAPASPAPPASAPAPAAPSAPAAGETLPTREPEPGDPAGPPRPTLVRPEPPRPVETAASGPGDAKEIGKEGDGGKEPAAAGPAKEKPAAAKVLVLTFDDLASFDATKEGAKAPAEVLAWSGRKASITAFMLPIDLDDDGRVRAFFLAPHVPGCCFGLPLRPNDLVRVDMAEGRTCKWSARRVTVIGILTVFATPAPGEQFYYLAGETVDATE
jgi:hypothetical protein